MDTNQLQSMTIVQLRVLAKEKGVHSPTTLNKAQLIQKLSEKLNSETPAVTQHEYPADSFKQDAGSINDASLSYSDQDDHTARNIPHIQEQQVNNYNSENTPPSQTDSNPTEENAPGQYSYAPGRQAYRPNYKISTAEPGPTTTTTARITTYKDLKTPIIIKNTALPIPLCPKC